MKGSFHLLATVLACCAITGHAAVPAAYYPADGASTDQSGNGNDAILPGFSSVPAYATGKVGQAFNLDGTNRYVDFGSWFTFESFTIGMWVKDGGSQTTGAPIISLFSVDGPNNIAFSLAAASAAGHYVYFGNDGALPVAVTLTPGTWQYLAITRDATSHVTTIYVDGVPVGTATGTRGLFLNAQLISGLRSAGNFNLTASWNGLLDELRFYDRPLSASEVAGLSADYNAVRDFSLVTPQDTNQTWQYGYTAANGTGFTNYDTLGQLTGTVGGVTKTGNPKWYPSGQPMSVLLNSSGGTLDYNIGTQQPVDELAMFPNGNGQKSIVRWKAPSAGTYQVSGLFEGIESAGGATTSDATIVKNVDASNPLLFSTGVPTPNPIPPMQNPAVNFINGFGTQAPFSFAITLAAGDTLDFRVGWGSNGTYDYDGTGFKATITAITPAVAAPVPPGLVSWWRGEGNPNDYLNANNGTVVGTVTFPSAKVGQGFGLNGIDQTILIGNPASLQLQDFSIDAWIQRADNGAVSRNPAGPFGLAGLLAGGNNGYGFDIAPDGTLGLTKIGVDGVSSTGAKIADLKFHHVAVTKSGPTVTFYVDGVAATADLNSYDPGFTFNSFNSNTYIGDFGSGGGQFWGTIDEVHFFNRGLTAAEIQSINAAGSAGLILGPPPLPAITTVSKTGPSTPGGNIHFTCSTQASVSVRVQSSTTPDTEGSWTDIPGGTATESPAGTYTLDTTAYPLTSGVYFRFISSMTNFADGKSANTLLGPYDLTNTITFSANGPASAGAFIHFTATTAPVWNVRVQSTTKPSPAEADWSDLNDGNGGHMTESSGTPGSYALDTTVYPAGTTVSFRAIASKTGYTDVIAVPLGPLVLHQAVLSITADLLSTSDWARGATAYVDDYLIYKLTSWNRGDAAAKSLRVIATVPTFIHADIPLVVKTVSGSKTISLASGDTSQLAIGGNLIGSNTLIPGTATITAITDATHFVISQAATGTTTGTTTATTTAVFGSTAFQFPASDLSLSPGGIYVPESSPGAGDAKMQWDLDGDLQGAVGLIYYKYVSFSVHLTGKVRTDQDLSIGNDYMVFSTTAPRQPAYAVTGATSNAPHVSCHVNGNISFLLNPLATTVAPGGYITYVFSLTNRGTVAATNPAAVVEVPDNTRFAATYANGAKGVTFIGTGTLIFKEVYHTGNPLPQVVLKFPSLAAKTTVQVKVIFQAKWADPTEVPKISTINYGAAFLDATQPKPISAASQFGTLFNIASVNPAARTPTDFFALISDPNNKIARSLNQSGGVNVTLSGSLDDAPVLDAFKQLSNTLTKSEDDGDGSNRLDLVKPGEKLTFMIVLRNGGPSPADEVYVTERMPDHCTYVAKSAVLFGATTPSKTKSTLVCTPDADGHHLVFTGLHLEPNDTVTFTYTALVDATLTVPAPTDPPLLLAVGAFSCGSGSITHTPEGFATALFIKVIGTAQLYAQPSATAYVINPRVILNTDKATTAATLDALYLKTPSAQPFKDPKAVIDPNHPPVYIDGVERIYVHYENTGNAGASGVKVTFPLPANTAFYRASWIALTANAMPGTIAKPPTGGTFTAPAKLAESGNVVFNLATLAAGGKGDVMVEFLVLASGVQANSAHIGGTDVITITDSLTSSLAQSAGARVQSAGAGGPTTQDLGLTQPFVGNHKAQQVVTQVTLDSSYLPSYDQVPPTPSFAVARVISKQNVTPGEQFTITLAGLNNGDVDCAPSLVFHVPNNTILVSIASGGAPVIPDSAGAQPGAAHAVVLYSNNDTNVGSLQPHTAGSVTFTLQATGAAGSSIVDSGAELDITAHDPVIVEPATINIVDAATLVNRPNLDHFQVFGHSFSQLHNGVRMIDLGGGNVIAQGAGNVIAQGAGNLLTQDGSGIVATGAGNLIAVQNPSTLGFVSTASLLSNNSFAITNSKIGNLVVQATTAVIAQGAGNVVAQGAGNLVSTNGGNVAVPGGGNVIAQGAGNVVAQGAGNLVVTGDGNIIAAGAGNVIAQGAGNVIAQGAGNVVAQGAGNVIAQGAGNVAANASASIVAQGAGNVVAQGAGN